MIKNNLHFSDDAIIEVAIAAMKAALSGEVEQVAETAEETEETEEAENE